MLRAPCTRKFGTPAQLLTDSVCLAEMATQHISGVTILTELQFQQIDLHLAVLDEEAMLHYLQTRGTGEAAAVPHRAVWETIGFISGKGQNPHNHHFP